MFSLVRALVVWSRFTCSPERRVTISTSWEWPERWRRAFLRFCVSYLSRCVGADELVVNLLGFRGQLWRFSSLVVLTSQVEGDVLLAELRHQERSEQAESVWKKKEERVNILSKLKVTMATFLWDVIWRTYFDLTTVCQTTPSMSVVRLHSACRQKQNQMNIIGST